MSNTIIKDLMVLDLMDPVFHGASQSPAYNIKKNKVLSIKVNQPLCKDGNILYIQTQ